MAAACSVGMAIGKRNGPHRHIAKYTEFLATWLIFIPNPKPSRKLKFGVEL